jgi:hypothetical protein
MKKHIGSTIFLVLGIVALLGGLSDPTTSLLISGSIIILGALAFRSAKNRKLGTVKNSVLRKALELSGIVAIILSIALRNNLKYLIITDPVPNVLIPFLAVVAYAVIALLAMKASLKKPETELDH